MSANSLGISMPFGLTYGYNDDYSINTFLNCAPDIITLKYYKNINYVNSMQDLESYDTSLLKYGDSLSIKNIDNDNNTSYTQYFWDNKKWIKIGNLNCSSFINIYSCSLNNENKLDTEEFFMRGYFNSIQSNIKLMQLLRSDYGIYNFDMITFCGLKGSYNTNLNDILKNLININITNSIKLMIKKLCIKYNIDIINPDNLTISLINSLYNIIEQSNTLFYQLSREINNIDISMYTNFIGACFSSLKYILESKYEKLSSIIFNNDVELQLIDQNFYDRIANNKDIKLFAQEFIQIIQDIIYLDTSNNSYYTQLNRMINYFDYNNGHILRIKKNRLQLYKDLCEGIAGIVNLALLFGIISNCAYGGNNSIYFHFITPEKFMKFK